MWKSDKVRIMSHFSPCHEPFVILYLVLTSQNCGSVEWSDKVRMMLHFSPHHEPSVILYLVRYTSQKRGSVKRLKKLG